MSIALKCAFCGGPISKTITHCPACGQAARGAGAGPARTPEQPGPQAKKPGFKGFTTATLPATAPAGGKPAVGSAGQAGSKPKKRQGHKPVDDLVMAALALEEQREATQPQARPGVVMPRVEPKPAGRGHPWRRYAAVASVLLLGGAFSPPGRAATANWIARRAASSLGYVTVSAQELGASGGQVGLPNGSTSAMDEQLHHQLYRFDRTLGLLNGKQVTVAFELDGFQGTSSAVLARARKLAPDLEITTELHRRHRFKVIRFTEPDGAGASHPGQKACYYQLEDSAESSLGLLVHYDPARSEPLATAAVLDHVLGSVQE